MDLTSLIIVASGVVVGIGASFTGLGGGFLMIPILLYLGFNAQKAVGTSFLAILVISVSALIAHNKFENKSYKSTNSMENTFKKISSMIVILSIF